MPSSEKPRVQLVSEMAPCGTRVRHHFRFEDTAAEAEGNRECVQLAMEQQHTGRIRLTPAEARLLGKDWVDLRDPADCALVLRLMTSLPQEGEAAVPPPQ